MRTPYWTYLQLAQAAIIACTGLSFAFPKARPACAVAVIAVIALSGTAPGMPLWLRLGCWAVAMTASIVFVAIRRSARATGAEPR